MKNEQIRDLILSSDFRCQKPPSSSLSHAAEWDDGNESGSLKSDWEDERFSINSQRSQCSDASYVFSAQINRMWWLKSHSEISWIFNSFMWSWHADLCSFMAESLFSVHIAKMYPVLQLNIGRSQSLKQTPSTTTMGRFAPLRCFGRSVWTQMRFCWEKKPSGTDTCAVSNWQVCMKRTINVLCTGPFSTEQNCYNNY